MTVTPTPTSTPTPMLPDPPIHLVDSRSLVRKITNAREDVWVFTGHNADLVCLAVAVDASFNVYSTGSDRTVRKLSSTGAEQWLYTHDDDVTSVAVDQFGNVITGTFSGRVTKLNSDGDFIWEYDIGPYVRAVAVDANGCVIAGSEDGALTKLSAAGGVIWRYDEFGDAVISVAFDHLGNPYGSSRDNTIRKFDTDGNLRWSTDYDVDINDIALDAFECVYLAMSDGTTRKINRNGVEQWSLQTNKQKVLGVSVDVNYNVYSCSIDGTLTKMTSGGVFIWEYIRFNDPRANYYGVATSPLVGSNPNRWNKPNPVSLTQTPTVTPTGTQPLMTLTAQATPTRTPDATPPPTRTPTPTPAASQTVTPTISVTPSITPSVTAAVTITPTPTATGTPPVTPTQTPGVTATVTPSITPTLTPTSTSAITSTPDVTPSPTATATPAVSPTPSVTPSSIPQFISQWDTTTTYAGSSAADTIVLPLLDSGTYNFQVDWGDGNSETITAASQGTHTYSSGGSYTVTITGSIDGWQHDPFTNTTYGGDSQKITNISSWGPLTIHELYQFYDCRNLTITATDVPTINETDLSFLFGECYALTTIPNLALWDVSAVTNMSGMFIASSGTSNFNSPGLDSWDVSSVTDFSNMFQDAVAFNQPLNSWTINTSSPVNMGFVFNNASSFNQDLNNWNMTEVTTVVHMFNGASSFTGNVTTWNTPNLTAITSVFANATAFNGDITGWDVSNVSSFGAAFQNATSFNQNLSLWNVTSSATNMVRMFEGAVLFNQNISNWDTSNVSFMTFMFDGALAFDQNLANWDIGSLGGAPFNALGSFFANGSGLSTANYDATLIGWAAQTPNTQVIFGAGTSQYTPGGAAEAARDTLDITLSWSITDGGPAAAPSPTPTVTPTVTPSATPPSGASGTLFLSGANFNTVRSIPFAAPATATTIAGNMLDAPNSSFIGLTDKSGLTGFQVGGQVTPTVIPTRLTSFPMSAPFVTATDVGSISESKSTGAGVNSSTDGHSVGGSPTGGDPAAVATSVARFPFSVPVASSTSIGDLTAARAGSGGGNSSTDGYVAMAFVPSQPAQSQTIERFPFASPFVTATNIGSATAGIQEGAHISSATDGYLVGGFRPAVGPAGYPQINSYPFSSPFTTALVVANQLRSRARMANNTGSIADGLGMIVGGQQIGDLGGDQQIDIFPFAAPFTISVSIGTLTGTPSTIAAAGVDGHSDS